MGYVKHIVDTMLTQCRHNADNVKMKAMKATCGNTMADQMSKTSLTDSLSNMDPRD